MLALPIMSVSACLVSYGRVKALTIYNVVNKIVLLGCVIWLALIWRTPEAAVYGTVTAAFLVFLPAILLMYKSTAKGSWLPSLENMWGQVKYSVPLGISIMIGVIAINLDKVVVSSMCPPIQFAVYVNGAFEVPLISIITGSAMAILLPEFTSLHQDGNHEKIIYLWHGAMKRCAVIIFPIMIFLLVTAPEVMRIVFSDRYVESAVPFRIYLLLLPIRITQFGAILMAAGRSRLILIRSAIGLLINLVLSVILVKFIGYLGAAIATVISIYFWSIPFNLRCINSILGEKLKRFLPYADLLKILFYSLIAVIPVLFLNRFVDLPDVILLSIEILIYGTVVLVLLQISGYINIFQLFKKDIGKMFQVEEKETFSKEEQGNKEDPDASL
jgi:O-antigen/teichoic acid export membrane protein